MISLRSLTLMKRKIKMTKRKLILISLLVLTLAFVLSGCGGEGDDLEGKNIVTFVVNGGTLNYGTSSTTSEINFAYHPGTYIIDPTDLPNYAISRNGYNFTGWYTSVECRANEKWDFTKTFETEKLVLYAGWEKAITLSYTVYYTDGDKSTALGSYNVSSGDKFEDWRKYASKREGYTGIGYYSDAECLVEWNFDYKHPGGETDLDIPVYVKYIEGEWQIVDSYEKLKSAIQKGNVYLTSDIDCGGEELFFSNDFDKIFEGNGFTVSNFTVTKSNTAINPAAAIFKSLGEKAVVKNVSFKDVTFKFFGIRESTDTIEVKANVAALAVSISVGATVTDVSVVGKIETDYSGSLSRLNEPYYQIKDKNATDADVMAGISGFSADITVDKQS